MSNHNGGYHTGYESIKFYQAEMREARAQERLARQTRAAHPAGSPRSIATLLRRLGSGLWATGQQEANPGGTDPAACPKASVSHP